MGKVAFGSHVAMQLGHRLEGLDMGLDTKRDQAMVRPAASHMAMSLRHRLLDLGVALDMDLVEAIVRLAPSHMAMSIRDRLLNSGVGPDMDVVEAMTRLAARWVERVLRLIALELDAIRGEPLPARGQSLHGAVSS